jgi:hypothetical protein
MYAKAVGLFADRTCAAENNLFFAAFEQLAVTLLRALCCRVVAQLNVLQRRLTSLRLLLRPRRQLLQTLWI